MLQLQQSRTPYKNCRLEQKIKNRRIQEESDNKNSNKEEGFVRGLE